MTQLMSLYQILFSLEDSPDAKNVLNDLGKIPSITEDLLKKTENENKILAKKYADYDIFYAMGSGPNYGLAYKLAMTMFMEGALKHSAPFTQENSAMVSSKEWKKTFLWSFWMQATLEMN
jgi:glucosamine--fructose-6-phosphate aminotransferase (isomerizing)